MNKFFTGMLLFVPVAIIARLLGASPIIIFILSALAIIPLAKFIGEATEELTIYTGPALGGLLNATFGNATELIIAIFALHAGLIEVVKASLTGSIIGNILLVLGLSMLAGGWKRERQKFSTIGAKTSASTLLLAIVGFVIPAIFVATSPGIAHPVVQTVSVVVSVVMILAYFGYLFFTLRTHKHLYSSDVAEASHDSKWSKGKAIGILLVSTVAVAFMSEMLVASIEPLVHILGWTELFVGVIFVAIIGNAAEHASAVTVAIKNKMDLSLQVAVGSSTQIAMFVAPVLVLISLLFTEPMDLVFHTFELVVMIFSVLIVNSIIEDGESHWFEGVQLLVTYIIIAVAFFFHP